ncbi:MAG TPA: carboxypeptidase-like regulatory domain-containing protein [Aquaticitalea sp.]|nr:carboxypeptidase-like regulatory domain-containing protein [Aquaticitalea sp.]HNU59177.1 carboxypeptidase-like regulatory domain-containing protein [Aquaticitalea sp.]
MKQALLFIFLFSLAIVARSQDIKRVEISGKIVVNSEDLENVTIYNTSSNKGSLTDADGKFKIDVALNDIIEVRALQFQEFTFTIDQNIIDTKKATVFLVEKVNRLNEVVILPYDLTGNLLVDMERVKTFNPDMNAFFFGINDIGTYKFADDYQSKVENIAMTQSGQNIQYGANILGIVHGLLKPIFKSKRGNASGQDKSNIENEDVTTSSLRDYYSTHFIADNFGIPKEKIDDFVNFVEIKGVDYSLLERGKEMEFLEFLTQKSREFLNEKN